MLEDIFSILPGTCLDLMTKLLLRSPQVEADYTERAAHWQSSPSPIGQPVRRETSNVKGFGGRILGNHTFHLSRLTFHIFEGNCFTILPIVRIIAHD